MDLSKLSYTVQKKTFNILELKEKLNKKHKSLMLPSGISCILAFYIVLYNDRYFSYAEAVFENQNLESASKKFDLVILTVLAAAIIIFCMLSSEFKKTQNKYEEFRKDLIKTINNEFCTCKNTCTCRDDYIKYMEKNGIDLIFN